MTTYVTLIKLSGQSMKDIGNFGKTYEEGVKAGQKMGIKPVGAYATLGPYDAMFIYEAPDEKAAAAMVLSIVARQGGETETWTAIPMADFTKLTSRIKC